LLGGGVWWGVVTTWLGGQVTPGFYL